MWEVKINDEYIDISSISIKKKMDASTTCNIELAERGRELIDKLIGLHRVEVYNEKSNNTEFYLWINNRNRSHGGGTNSITCYDSLSLCKNVYINRNNVKNSSPVFGEVGSICVGLIQDVLDDYEDLGYSVPSMKMKGTSPTKYVKQSDDVEFDDESVFEACKTLYEEYARDDSDETNILYYHINQFKNKIIDWKEKDTSTDVSKVSVTHSDKLNIENNFEEDYNNIINLQKVYGKEYTKEETGKKTIYKSEAKSEQSQNIFGIREGEPITNDTYTGARCNRRAMREVIKHKENQLTPVIRNDDWWWLNPGDYVNIKGGDLSGQWLVTTVNISDKESTITLNKPEERISDYLVLK